MKILWREAEKQLFCPTEDGGLTWPPPHSFFSFPPLLPFKNKIAHQSTHQCCNSSEFRKNLGIWGQSEPEHQLYHHEQLVVCDYHDDTDCVCSSGIGPRSPTLGM